MPMTREDQDQLQARVEELKTLAERSPAFFKTIMDEVRTKHGELRRGDNEVSLQRREESVKAAFGVLLTR